jgi:hypothetical protein
MSAVIPYYKLGPSNKQVSTLIYGGQFVQPTTATGGTTDYTVKPALANSLTCLGVAGTDANVLTAQSGAANTYGQPQIDISVLTDYVPVYYGNVDIWVWYGTGANMPVLEGQKLIISATAGVCTGAAASPAADIVVGLCTQPGGVTAGMLTQQIGGQGAASFFLGRARIC